MSMSAALPTEMTLEKPTLLRLRPVQDRGHQRARLRDQADRARQGATLGIGRVEPDGRAHDAHAIRPQQADAVAARGFDHLRSSAAPFGPDSAKPAEMTTT